VQSAAPRPDQLEHREPSLTMVSPSIKHERTGSAATAATDQEEPIGENRCHCGCRAARP
jgi:hypothetical protein